MSQNSCCVPGCSVKRDDGVSLHRFPNPDADIERFNIWISNIGGEISSLDKCTIHANRRVCHRHFEDIYKYSKNKLSKLAIPVLHMPSSVSYMEPELPSTSFIGNIQRSVVTSGHVNIHKEKEQESTMQVDHITQKHPIKRKKSKCYVTVKDHKDYKKILKQLQKCQSDNLSLKKKYLNAKRMMKSEAFKIITKKMSPSAKLFCQIQATQSGREKEGRRFSLDEKILALSLYKPSPKAYRLLSKLIILPSRRTLQSLLTKVPLKAGINDIIFENLKSRVSSMPESHKYCSLLFDEMAIGPGVTYIKKSDQIIGFVDNGDIVQNEYADHVLVFMVRGIVKKYKQPLAYYFCSGSTKAIELKKQIKTVICKIQETGLRVITTICDQGATNVASINNMLHETREKYLRMGHNDIEGYFEVNGEKIYPIFDPPHLIKGIRNNLMNKNLQFVLEGKLRIAKWSHILSLYKRQTATLNFNGVKLVPKLTAQHVIPELIPKMRVKHCTQVFSQSVAVAIGIMADLGVLDKDSADTAHLLMFFDNLFDSVNGSFSAIRGGKVYRAAVTPSSPHHKLWKESLPVLRTMKFINGDKQGVVPSLSSWIKTIENIQRIVNFLNNKGVTSLLLRNLNQDSLENFFGAIRSHGYSNIMPNSTAFENAFKTLLINNISSSHSVGSNCEKDDSVCLQSLKQFLIKPGVNITTEFEDEIENTHLCLDLIDTDALISSMDPIKIEKCAAIGYCSGWIANTAKKIYKNCIECKNNLEVATEQTFHKFIKKKEFANKRWLCYPSKALFNFFAQIENICTQILNSNCTRKNILSYIKLIITINLNTNFLNCNVHKNKLAEHLINKCSIFFINNWCREINNLLSGKTDYLGNDLMLQKALKHFSKNKGRKRKRGNTTLVHM